MMAGEYMRVEFNHHKELDYSANLCVVEAFERQWKTRKFWSSLFTPKNNEVIWDKIFGAR